MADDIAVNYIGSFYQDLEELLNATAFYNQLRKEIENRYPSESARLKMEEEDRRRLMDVITRLRYFLLRTKTKFIAIAQTDAAFSNKNEEIKTIYSECDKGYIINYDFLEKYNELINAVFVQSQLSALLVKNQDILKAYSGANYGSQ